MHGWHSVVQGYLICLCIVVIFYLSLEFIFGVPGALLSTVLSAILGVPFAIWALKTNTDWIWPFVIGGGVFIGWLVTAALLYTAAAIEGIASEIIYLTHKTAHREQK